MFFYTSFSTTFSTFQAGIDDVSVDLSVDWTPPNSARQSRRNTIFSVSPGNIKANGFGLMPLTVAALRQYANSPPDVAEEERKEKVAHESVAGFLDVAPHFESSSRQTESLCRLRRAICRVQYRDCWPEMRTR
ncbi:hypothetical protein COOONC_23430 [Cooperia oncophora]